MAAVVKSTSIRCEGEFPPGLRTVLWSASWFPRRDNSQCCTWASVEGALPITRTYKLFSRIVWGATWPWTTYQNNWEIFPQASCWAPVTITQETEVPGNCTTLQTGLERWSLGLTGAHLTFLAGSGWVSGHPGFKVALDVVYYLHPGTLTSSLGRFILMSLKPS